MLEENNTINAHKIDAESNKNKNVSIDQNDNANEILPNEHILHTGNGKKLQIDKDFEFRPKNPIKRALFFVIWCVAYPFIWLYNHIHLGLKIKHKRYIKYARKFDETGKKRKSGIVSVSNHVHYMDCAMNANVCHPKMCRFTTISENFTIPIAGILVQALGGIAIPDDKKYMRNFFLFLQECLNKKQNIHFYPESALHPYCTDIRPFARGAFMIATKCNVPIVPIVYVQRKPNLYSKIFRKGKPCFTAIVLRPLYANKSLPSHEQSVDLMNRTHNDMNRIHSLYSAQNNYNVHIPLPLTKEQKRQLKHSKKHTK